MAFLPETWLPIARALGFETEKEMLYDLYVKQGFSLDEISRMLGYARGNVRRRIRSYGIETRTRGGKNNSKPYLANISDEALKTPQKTAKALGVHVSTVFMEKRRRRLQRQENQECTSQQSPQLNISIDLQQEDTVTSSLPSGTPPPETMQGGIDSGPETEI